MSTSTLSGTRLRVPRYGSSLPHSDYDDSVTSLPSGSLHLTSDADETDPETAPNRTQPRVAVSDDESPASKLRRAIARANNLSYQPSRSATSTTRMDAPSVHDSDIDDPSEPDHDLPESEALSEARSQLKAVFAKALGPPRDDELKPRRLTPTGHDESLFRRSANQLEPLESLSSRTREEHTQDSYKSILEDIESIDNKSDSSSTTPIVDITLASIRSSDFRETSSPARPPQPQSDLRTFLAASEEREEHDIPEHPTPNSFPRSRNRTTTDAITRSFQSRLPVASGTPHHENASRASSHLTPGDLYHRDSSTLVARQTPAHRPEHPRSDTPSQRHEHHHHPHTERPHTPSIEPSELEYDAEIERNRLHTLERQWNRPHPSHALSAANLEGLHSHEASPHTTRRERRHSHSEQSVGSSRNLSPTPSVNSDQEHNRSIRKTSSRQLSETKLPLSHRSSHSSIPHYKTKISKSSVNHDGSDTEQEDKSSITRPNIASTSKLRDEDTLDRPGKESSTQSSGRTLESRMSLLRASRSTPAPVSSPYNTPSQARSQSVDPESFQSAVSTPQPGLSYRSRPAQEPRDASDPLLMPRGSSMSVAQEDRDQEETNIHSEESNTHDDPSARFIESQSILNPKTPRPPGSWATPARVPAFAESTSSQINPVESQTTMTKTPAPPGGWAGTPAMASVRRQVRFDQSQVPEESVPSDSESNVNPEHDVSRFAPSHPSSSAPEPPATPVAPQGFPREPVGPTTTTQEIKTESSLRAVKPAITFRMTDELGNTIEDKPADKEELDPAAPLAKRVQGTLTSLRRDLADMGDTSMSFSMPDPSSDGEEIRTLASQYESVRSERGAQTRRVEILRDQNADLTDKLARLRQSFAETRPPAKVSPRPATKSYSLPKWFPIVVIICIAEVLIGAYIVLHHYNNEAFLTTYYDPSFPALYNSLYGSHGLGTSRGAEGSSCSWLLFCKLRNTFTGNWIPPSSLSSSSVYRTPS
ncbi:hypothetical protein SISSUDRAFT_616986 [Sistotremastrum suecicum HHB10207 ss-3]|uniref:Uncharacterized protein n=1 Tax=Sistotremastrum suecicum HHB10207 ss-3 TaxID=1314776 RepID=A0A166IEU2_9AGAM|nr:hypothetical protein SISSUDRAFT_616986 [Sistotremastrum suecicum HHB10207 ss-3]